jgi:hypothetical protein
MVSALLAAGPQAVRLQKALMRVWEDQTVSRAVSAGIDAYIRAYETDEPARMLSAFINRERD